MSDLIERLRGPKGFLDSSHHQAADELERKDAAIAELVGAIRSAFDAISLGEAENILRAAIAKHEPKQDGK